MSSFRISANGLEFECLSSGTGPLVLCAHGFPENAKTFDRTLDHLASLGFRAVAPHMRGYHPTSVRAPRYHGNDLGEDLLAIADVLSPSEPVTLIGHDWGAVAVYRASAMRPDRVRHLITVGFPHPAMVRPSFGLAWALRHFIVFQLESFAAKKMREKDFAYVDHLYGRWSPSWKAPAEETAPVKETFRAPGSVEAALAYYQHFARPTRDEARRAKELDREPIRAPSTIVLGRADPALSPKSVRERPDKFPKGTELVWIDGAGHFVHRENPDAWLAVLTRVLSDRTGDDDPSLGCGA